MRRRAHRHRKTTFVVCHFANGCHDILESEDEHFYDWNHFGYHWPLCGLGLGDPVLEKVYRTNALKILQKRASAVSASRAS